MKCHCAEIIKLWATSWFQLKWSSYSWAQSRILMSSSTQTHLLTPHPPIFRQLSSFRSWNVFGKGNRVYTGVFNLKELSIWEKLKLFSPSFPPVDSPIIFIMQWDRHWACTASPQMFTSYIIKSQHQTHRHMHGTIWQIIHTSHHPILLAEWQKNNDQQPVSLNVCLNQCQDSIQRPFKKIIWKNTKSHRIDQYFI